MITTDGTFAQWLAQAQIAERRLTAEQRGLASRRPLPSGNAARQRLLFQPAAQPFPAALRLRTQSRADRPPGRLQPAHGLAPARRLFQGGDPGRPPPPGRPAPRQTAATLCRPHRRVHADPRRRHPLRHLGLHPAHLGRPRVHGGLAPLLQEVRPRSRHAGSSHRPPSRPRSLRSRRACARRRRMLPRQPVPLPPPPFSSTPDPVCGRLPADAHKPWTGWPPPRTVSPTTTAPCVRAC